MNETGNIWYPKRSDLLKCPFTIMVPHHYREDGTCRCDDLEHRAMMIAEWEYTPEDFIDIPIRSNQ